MTTNTKPKVRPKAGDVAFCPAAAVFGQPWFMVDRVEFDSAGNVTGYNLSSPENPNIDSTYVEARKVSAVLSNVLTAGDR